MKTNFFGTRDVCKELLSLIKPQGESARSLPGSAPLPLRTASLPLGGLALLFDLNLLWPLTLSLIIQLFFNLQIRFQDPFLPPPHPLRDFRTPIMSETFCIHTLTSHWSQCPVPTSPQIVPKYHPQPSSTAGLSCQDAPYKPSEEAFFLEQAPFQGLYASLQKPPLPKILQEGKQTFSIAHRTL